ncbi:substrate-binding domain-containing protein [Candidatus Sumerlaeota bacterium]|nr:substrate-binding domain-containing protein [Candidatus Sumerlaeota bacterium]
MPEQPRVAITFYPTMIHRFQIVSGISNYLARTLRFCFVIYPTEEMSTLQLVKKRGFDGIIALVREKKLGPTVKELLDTGLPTVNVGGDNWQAQGLPQVIVDEVEAGRTAARYLLDRGFTRLGYAGNPLHWPARQREKGFVEAAAEVGVKASSFATHESASPSSLKENTDLAEWLRRLPPPAGILAEHDYLARRVALNAQRTGLRVPEDLAILGVGNSPRICLGTVPPTLSSIDSAWEVVGSEAARLLGDLIEGAPPPTRPILIPPAGVVSRHSTDVFCVENPVIARALRFIADHASEPIHVEDISRQLGVSRSTLEKGFRQYLRRSPNAEIIRQHLERARELLDRTDLRISQIGAASGFRDYRALDRAFHREMGISPSAYRERRGRSTNNSD